MADLFSLVKFQKVKFDTPRPGKLNSDLRARSYGPGTARVSQARTLK